MKTKQKASNPIQPPRLAEVALAALLPAEEREIVLGDFAEAFIGILGEQGAWHARLWYWKEMILSLPFFTSLKLRKTRSRRPIMRYTPVIQPTRRSSLALSVLLLPALFLAIPGIAQSLSGSSFLYDVLKAGLNFGKLDLWSWLIHPVAVLGGLGAALLLGAISLLSISVESEGESLVTMLAVRKSAWNLGPFVLGLLLAVTIFIYMLAENFGPLL